VIAQRLRAIPQRLRIDSAAIPQRFCSDCKAVAKPYRNDSVAITKRLHSTCTSVASVAIHFRVALHCLFFTKSAALWSTAHHCISMRNIFLFYTALLSRLSMASDRILLRSKYIRECITCAYCIPVAPILRNLLFFTRCSVSRALPFL
jgi:hypothetical protein